MRLNSLFLVLIAAIIAIFPSDSSAQRPGFYFENSPDTLHFFTNSSQSLTVYARNNSDVPLSFWADYQHAGGTYGMFDVEDESFLELTAPNALVKTVITFTPKEGYFDRSAAGKIYLYDTGYVVCDSIYFIGVPDTNRQTARALFAADTLIDFGKVDIGQSHTAQLLLKNKSSETLIVDTMMINGFKFSRQFTIDELPVFPFSMQPNATKIVELTFTPDGSPGYGWNDLMINYHIGETFQTTTVEMIGESGKFAAGSADTLDLGPIPMYAFVGKKVRLKNNLADSVEVYDYDPFSYPNLVVVMDSEGDSMVLGPQEEKEVIIYGLGMGFEGMEQTVKLEFATHNGPLLHLGFVDVIVRTETTEEDIDNPDRIFPLMGNSVIFIPYGTEIEVFGGGTAQFGETLQFENIEDHDILVTEAIQGDSASTGYALTNFASLPATLAPAEVLTVEMDRYDSVQAAGWLLVITDSSDVAKISSVELPPIVAPKQSVAINAAKTDVRITPGGNRSYHLTALDLDKAHFTIFDLSGREVASVENGMTWTAPAAQAYLILVDGKQNGKPVRKLVKLIVQ